MQYPLEPRSKWKMLRRYCKSEVRISRYLDTSTEAQVAKIMVQYGTSSRSSRKRTLYGHPLAGLLWERQFVKVVLEHGWDKVPNWECLIG